MKIAHYDHEIWAKGGLASYIRRVASTQRELGHEVVFFSKRESGLSDSGDGALLVPTNEALYLAAEQLDIDILHTHRSLELSPPANLPVIRTVHGHAPYCPSGSRFLAKQGCPCNRAYHPARCLAGHLLDRCGSIRPLNLWQGFQETRRELDTLTNIPTVAVSNFIRLQLLRAGYIPENLHVLHLFAPDITDTPPPLSEQDCPHFVVVGRIDKTKGIRWLLKALHEVKAEVRLDVVGDGPLLPEMEIFAQKLGIEELVQFHGWVQPDEVARLINQARALVFPSIWHEPGGTVAFEAMSQARAVIMSRVGGMLEVVRDGETGLLVEPSNVKQLAEAIQCLARDSYLAEELGRAGYEQVSKCFSRTQHLAQLMGLYEQTILQKCHDISHNALNKVAI